MGNVYKPIIVSIYMMDEEDQLVLNAVERRIKDTGLKDRVVFESSAFIEISNFGPRSVYSAEIIAGLAVENALSGREEEPIMIGAKNIAILGWDAHLALRTHYNPWPNLATANQY